MNIHREKQRKTKVKTGSQSKQTRKSDKELVSIPNHVSLRAKEKSFLLRFVSDEAVQKAAYGVSYVSAFCLIFVGVALLLSATTSNKDIQTQVASIEAASKNSSVSAPKFEQLTKIPDFIDSDFLVTFFTPHISSLSIEISEIGSNSKILLPPKQLGNDKYQVLIPYDTLYTGVYDISFIFESIDKTENVIYRSTKFDVYKTDLNESNDVQKKSESDLPDSKNESALLFDKVPRTALVANTVDSKVSPQIKLNTSIPDTIENPYDVKFETEGIKSFKVMMARNGALGFLEVPATKSSDSTYKLTIPVDVRQNFYELNFYVEPQNESRAAVFKTKVFWIGPEDEMTDDFDLSKDNLGGREVKRLVSTFVSTESHSVEVKFALVKTNTTTLSGNAVIGVSTPDEYSFVELYARPTNSLQSQFVVLASRRFDQWQFVFNSANLPNGEYEFFARTKHNGKTLDSEKLKLFVSNDGRTSPTHNTRPINYSQPPSDNQPERNTISIYDNNDDFVREYTPEEVVAFESTNLLNDNKDELEVLLKRYSSAVQSGDEVLIQSAKLALKEEKENIAYKALSDNRVRDIADDVNLEIESRLNDLMYRVETFEELRTRRTNGDSATDTDGDGISDIDESTLYETDPEVTDTDGDGISDGIEIIRGFNPNDPTVEAVVRFESPKETLGLERESVLLVEEIIDVIPTVETGPVKAEIRGKGLPNSYLRIYIFSEPIMVTVKTDSDGSFVYTFDKELEDGKHEIYVAVTDNAGKIVAQSKPFAFLFSKEAQAFTPVDAAEETVLTTDESFAENSAGSYNLVVGVGILSLGAILLLVGISLRPKEDGELDDDTDSNEDDACEEEDEDENKIIITEKRPKTLLDTKPHEQKDIS